MMAAIVGVTVIPAIVGVTVIPAMFARIAVTAMLFLVMLNVFAVVPVLPDEEHGLAAGVVLVAMLLPVFGVARRHMQIERRTIRGNLAHDHGLDVDHLRLREAADVDAAIESGLAEADRDVGGECRGGGDEQCCRDKNASHGELLFGWKHPGILRCLDGLVRKALQQITQGGVRGVRVEQPALSNVA